LEQEVGALQDQIQAKSEGCCRSWKVLQMMTLREVEMRG
jgi:hypothetical protein